MIVIYILHHSNTFFCSLPRSEYLYKTFWSKISKRRVQSVRCTKMHKYMVPIVSLSGLRWFWTGLIWNFCTFCSLFLDFAFLLFFFVFFCFFLHCFTFSFSSLFLSHYRNVCLYQNQNQTNHKKCLFLFLYFHIY